MKHFLVLLIFLLTYYSSNAQDVIITNDGDSIDCKITRVTNEFVHFTIFDKSGIRVYCLQFTNVDKN